MIIELKLFVYSGTLHCQTITIIKANCSRSTGRLLRRHENRTGYGFCSHTRTVISERFLQAAPREAAPRAQFARTGIRTVAEVNKYKRGLERIETGKYSG